MLSLAGVAFSTAALIIVLSVFNGLGDLLRSLNNSFDPDLKITPATGKSFVINDDMLKKIQHVAGVESVTEVIEDYAYARYRDANKVVTLKGVSSNFIDQHQLENTIIAGDFKLQEGDIPYALISQGIQYELSIAIEDNFYALQLFYIKNAPTGTLDVSKLYSKKNIVPVGVFSVFQQLDHYIIVPLDFARDLMSYGNKRTSLEIKTTDVPVAKVQQSLRKILGDNFLVLNQEEQHKDLYRLLKMEKLFTFLALSLLVGISSINIFFTLMMLALDKKKDLSILSAMGATPDLIKRIFITEGAIIAFVGAALGLLIGAGFCLLQQHAGLISMGIEDAVTEGYPVKMQWTDFVLTLFVVATVTFIISWRPAVLASRSPSILNL